ncbi:bifunctional 4-hydroxy-2-oxoglutarate aldolase/2-dehydro-3-deoxy-phosphogluconate aldolase [Tanticharoenia sakaeratensis]|uniref:2-dehydro-3-deoxy-phosphogluconate aldolase n=1 Tax=Tanticharoenia sakaeratensis NBRC 103193 TaxID=1231623 RepID=A0A0D6MI18_9PROT|nr:bifunctional 4-hydroxy-2-oxoglutarate aldolase/2-dehydro-3-deoxy-phosphogluconate aldolase [Tanticharoenia sakaeratensis]GAN53156.1 KHG/KDPG aldolase [Tanticharoenia sakaeratensis NBRC 103193]GBQ24894.1 2-dehydro-3-deoxyphosphogluconate aldolase [Tanticharoenia sakaeratensis NBRC 103193]
MQAVETIMRTGPVIPVLVIQDVAHARPVAEALVAGGIRVLEVTLRTSCAIDVIREMSAVDGAIVGAGTVLNEDDLDRAVDAGAQFIVSPGLTKGIARAAADTEVPLLPGVANASDIMRGLDLGLNRFKFFPAEASGGLAALKALSAPFGDVRFCPTGGITEATAPQWLAHPSVLCCGGSWLVGPGVPDTAAIKARAQAASALRS